MAKKKSSDFSRKVDPLIETAIQKVGGPYFTKPEVINIVCKDKRIANILKDVRQRFKGWSIDWVIKEGIKKRLERILQITDRVTTPDGEIVKIRRYECYAIGEGPRRWQLLRAMTISDLRICLQARRRQRAGMDSVIGAYQRAIDEMERTGAEKVEEIFAIAIGELVRDEVEAVA